MTRIADPQINFADIEFLTQGIDLDPILKRMSDFLDDQPKIVERVRRDLERGLKKPDTGRTAMTPTQVLRSLILMRVKNWDYRELSERIADGYTLRRFTGFNSQRVPKHDAFNRAFNKLRPQTLQALNDLVLKAAVDLGLEDGKRLRVDTTVTETDIHHPTDNTLLWDVVRVLTRLIGRLGKVLPKGIDDFSNRTRCARRRMQEIQRMTARQRHTQQKVKYRHLIGITQQVVHNARGVLEKTKDQCAVDPMDDIIVGELRRKIDHYCQLGARVIDQSRRRVLEGEQVATEEKIYSIFETHTDLIKRGKIQKPIEFGHKIFLAESAHGLITQYRVLEGNPPDQSTSSLHCSVIRKLSVGLPLGTVLTEAFSAMRTSKRARRSSSSAFRSGVEKEPLNGKRLKKALSSRRDNASGPASRAVSPCCFAAAA